METESQGLSRRGLLKGAGVGAAVIWSAPTIMSVGAIASASVNPGPSDCPIGQDWTCGDTVTQCSGTPAPIPNCGLPSDFICICDVDTEGRTFCWNNYCCANTIECSSSSDCSGEQRCVSSCCPSSTTFTCAPPCGANLPGDQSAHRGGGTAAG
jgi:hypothetical protein